MEDWSLPLLSLIPRSRVFGAKDRDRTSNFSCKRSAFFVSYLFLVIFFDRKLSLIYKEIRLKICLCPFLVQFFLDRSLYFSLCWVFILFYWMISLPVMPLFVSLFRSCQNFASETPFLQSVCGLIVFSDVFLTTHLKILLRNSIFPARFKFLDYCIHYMWFFTPFPVLFLVPVDNFSSQSHLSFWIQIFCFVCPSLVSVLVSFGYFSSTPFENFSLKPILLAFFKFPVPYSHPPSVIFSPWGSFDVS